jgi:cytochrome P450
LNFFITNNRIGNKFPLLSPLKYFFVPLKVLLSHFRIEKLNRKAVEERVARRHEPHPLDHFDSMLPPEAPVPVGREKVHLEILAGHLLVGGFETVSTQYHCAIMFLLLQPELQQALVDEVRTTFDKFEDIDADSLISLPFLNAVMNETLRMTVNVAAIIPRESPGAAVDGNYISRGVRRLCIGHHCEPLDKLILRSLLDYCPLCPLCLHPQPTLLPRRSIFPAAALASQRACLVRRRF